MTANVGKPDAPFRDQTTDETRFGVEQDGGFLDGEQPVRCDGRHRNIASP